jgi:hypothetical protein
MTNVQGNQAPVKRQKMFKKFEIVVEQSMSSETPLGISYEVCHEILTENLNMRRIAAKFVPRFLTNDQSSGA